MAEGDQVQLGYETAEVGRRPVVRAATAAVGMSAVFVGVALLMMLPGLPDGVRSAVVWPWVVAGVGAGAMAGLVAARVKRGRWQERRAGRWAAVLLVSGVVLGLVGVLAMPLQMTVHDGSPRVACAVHLRDIGTAIMLYANAHQGRYPDRLEPLLFEEGLSAKLLVCPVSGDDEARGPTTRAVADALAGGGHLSYVYVGAGLRTGCGPDAVVMYEPPANHHGAMNVLFGDGHVALVGKADAREIVDRIAAGERPVVWKAKGPASKPVAADGRPQ